MTMLRTLPLLALALLAACAKTATTTVVTAPQPVAAPLPPHPNMAGALFALAECDPDEDTGCDASPVAVRIDAARCVPIAPIDGYPAVACRLDWTKVMPPPHKEIVRRGECIRFIQLKVESLRKVEAATLWAVLFTMPGHVCEVPTR